MLPEVQLPDHLQASAEVVARAKGITTVIFDVDGVLTDGKLYYSANGIESKAFHVQDGAALKLLQSQGLQVAIITGRKSPMVRHRADELGIKLLQQNAGNKLEALEALLARAPSLAGVGLEQCACVGDDLADIVLFEALGLGISVPNGHPSARRAAHWVTGRAGGSGVAAEVAELLLRSQDRWSYP
ncbi:MAG: KdsC family phosphatase [Pseudomonadales bacterium]